MVLFSVSVSFAAMYMFWPTTYVWDARWLPFFWFSVEVAAGLGILLLLSHIKSRLSPHLAVLVLFVPPLAFSGIMDLRVYRLC